MARNYYQLLPYIFKRFSILSAFRTAVPTAWYYVRRKPLPPSERPALFTMNILPPMMTVWHHCARKHLGNDVDIVIFDCSGKLNAHEFPGARVQKFLNFYAATKSQEFLDHIAQNREIGWLCDDDVFFTNHEALQILQEEFSVSNTASVSFKPRTWWHFEMNGQQFEPSGSYCIAYQRSFLQTCGPFSLSPREGNKHPTHIGKGLRRYDTADWANECLLRAKYRCAVVPQETRDRMVASFTGMSGAVMLLHYFRNAEQTLRYFEAPTDQAWEGNTLYGLLSAMLSICTIQECYTQIRGKPYPLPSMPSRSELEAIRKRREPLLSHDRSFAWVDEVSERLRMAI